MSYQTPRIAQDIRRLRSEIERAVQGFYRIHKHSSGDILRAQARKMQGLVLLVSRDKANQAERLEQLRHEIDQLKEDMRLAQDIRAFSSFRQFQYLYRQADAIGRQAGGWSKSQKHPSAQNGQRQGAAQRGQILSTHAAPSGVYK